MSADPSSDSSLLMPEGHNLIETVLLIDRPDVTSQFRPVLEGFGWYVLEASNTGQARGLMERYKPDFVLSELVLPSETGFEYCAYQKKRNFRIPFVILTEIRLSAARNLAMWAGADAYLSKPIGPTDLYRSMLTVAVRVSERIAKAERGMSGGISFSCSCGRRLTMGAQNAGKASVCPGCRHLVRCPESTVDYGLLFRQLREEDQKSSISAAGIMCPHCRRTVDPLRCRIRDHFECTRCSKELRIPPETMERWSLFFHDTQPEYPVTEFNPLQYVYVRCESCQTYHQYFTAQDVPRPCPDCGRVQSLPSVRGAPLSRAALNATGRLFEVHLPDGRRPLFLLHPTRRCIVGSEKPSAVCFPGTPLSPQHCSLKMTLDGPELRRVNADATLTVEGQSVDDAVVLQPAEVVDLGYDISLRLLGNRRQSDEELIAGVQKQMKNEDMLTGDVVFAGPGAQIVQLFWEQQRDKWRAMQRQGQGMASRVD
jgi:CheY-like chemotaxis protein